MRMQRAEERGARMLQMAWHLMVCVLLATVSIAAGRSRLSDEVTMQAASVQLQPPPAVAEPTQPPPVEQKCYQGQLEDCPTEGDTCRCKTLPSDRAVVCCNVDSYFLKEGLACANYNINSTYLHIRNATLDEFNVSQSALKIFSHWSVTDGQITSVVGKFPLHTSIQCLNLSGNSIKYIEERAFAHLAKVTTVDLSRNNVTAVPGFSSGRAISLDISANYFLLCRSLFDAMNTSSPNLRFLSENETYCLSSRTFHWFNTTELVPYAQVENVIELQKMCGDGCSCGPHRLDIVPGKPPTFAVMVNCSGRQLTEMPSRLPPNTIALNVSNNNITELNIADVSYLHIRELYADNNQIQSILSLEGTKFLDNFVALSLRNNKLHTLQTYVLSNIFDRNYISRQVHLGLNRLHCDCNTAKVLKVWLLTKQKHIPDAGEIMCDNNPLNVLQLDPSKLCQHQSEQDWTDYIYYIITAEVLLLVCLVLKVSYDYWVFKTAGYLPWPASKMPKLPCDWLCE